MFGLGVALALAGCGPSKPDRPACPAGQVCLQFGNGAEPMTLDPHKSTGTWEAKILMDVFMGLTQDDAQGRPIPGMATSWETSADGLTWRFHLRDAAWSDGVPVTAQDFVFSFRRILDPKTASEFASMLYGFKNAQAINQGRMPATALGARALGPRELEIQLEHPAPYLPELLKHQVLYPVPEHVVRRWGEAWSQPARMVSNGAYTIKLWRLGDRITAVKNPRYYAADSVCVDQINYYPSSDAITGERRVRRGELDVNADIQSNRIAYLRKVAPEIVRTHTYLGLSYLAFNYDTPALRDIRVRQALSMAVDRDFITAKLLRGGQTPAYSFVPPGVANYASPPPPPWAAWPFERRHAEARRLLAQAGYGPGHPLRIEIKHRNTPDPMLIMPAIQADWRSIGVETTLQQNEVQIAYAAYRAHDFQVADAAWIADYNDPMTFLYLLQSTTGSQNYGDYRNPRYDALIDTAERQATSVTRARYLARAEALMLSDAAVTPLFYYVSKNLVSPNVTGWADNIIDHHPTRYLCLGPENQPPGG